MHLRQKDYPQCTCVTLLKSQQLYRVTKSHINTYNQIVNDVFAKIL